MCLACYLNCHLDHETYEIGLKRHFRCDCGLNQSKLLKYRSMFIITFERIKFLKHL
jgi:hypothetical protein